MADCSQEGAGYEPGGIASLCEFINDHKEAIESDLITSAGIELNEVGSALTMGALYSFLQNRSYDSALWRSTHEDMAEWSTTLKTNLILADIFDVLSQINANIVALGTRKKAQKTKPYPRAWAKDEKTKTIGKGALPPKELHEWFKNYGKRRK